MRVRFFCPRWGSEQLPWPEFLRQVKAAGYDGVEWAIAAGTPKALLDDVCYLAHLQKLDLIAQHYDTNVSDFDRHFSAFAGWLNHIRPYPWYLISSQTGKDYFTFGQNKRLIAAAGRNVVHETHRGKFSFAAHLTRDYLAALPELRLTLDVSHWCNVAESLLEDQPEAVELAISRTDHVHARIGFAEGPQVPDPRLPEWQSALETHLSWWDKVVALKRAVDAPVSFTTEFGPFPYLVNTPATGAPLADQWEINIFMLKLLKQRYA